MRIGEFQQQLNQRRWYGFNHEDDMTADPAFSSGKRRLDRSDTTLSSFWVRARSLRWVLGQTWDVAPSFLIGIVSLTLVRSMVPAALAWVAKSLIDSLTMQIDSSSTDASTIMPWLIAGLVLAMLDAVANAVRRYLSRRLADDLSLEVTTDILTHVSGLDIEFFEDVGKQDSLQRAKRTSGDRFVNLINHSFDMISSGLQVVSLTVVLVVIQPWTLALVVIILPPFLVARWMLARREFALEYDRTTKRRWSRYFVNLLTEKLRVAETRLLGLAPLLIRKYRSLMFEFRDQNRGMYLLNLRTLIMFSVVSAAGFFALLVDITLQALDGAATLGDVAVFFGASARLRTGIVSGVDAASRVVQDSLHVSALMELFESEGSERHPGEPVSSQCTGAIQVQDVDFSYPGSSVPVLQNLSFEIHAGETVALVGENGCGKTTLVKLIAHLYSPDRGRITLDGHDLEQLDLHSLHQQIAFVFQSFGRYEASAADNIAYGDWENCLDDRERVEQIAREAGVHDMITAMPEGYDTLLGRSFGTHDLSLGEWQKLAVARAFARRSALLILDEATASLDARAEYELFVQARKLAKGRTTILISHRFSTVSMADRILVMDEGKIIEQGSHRELLRHGGHYAELYRLHQRQTGSFENEDGVQPDS